MYFGKKTSEPSKEMKKKSAELIDENSLNRERKLRKKIDDLGKSINGKLSIKNLLNQWVTEEKNWRFMDKAQNYKIEFLIIDSIDKKSCDITAKSFGVWIACTSKEAKNTIKINYSSVFFKLFFSVIGWLTSILFWYFSGSAVGLTVGLAISNAVLIASEVEVSLSR